MLYLGHPAVAILAAGIARRGPRRTTAVVLLWGLALLKQREHFDIFVELLRRGTLLVATRTELQADKQRNINDAPEVR